MDRGLLKPGGNSIKGEKWSESEYIIKVKPTEYANKLGLECERDTVVKIDSNAFDLRNWKDGIAINRYGKDCGRKERNIRNSVWDISLRYLLDIQVYVIYL